MNTFNMKQWLTANKVGPYSKTMLTESEQVNDKWLEQFKEALHSMKLGKGTLDQILMIPSSEILSMYGDANPYQAAKDVARSMGHSAREGKEMTEDEDFDLEYNPLANKGDEVSRPYMEKQWFEEDEIKIDGQTYLVDYIVHFDYSYDRRGKELVIDKFEIELQNVFKKENGEWVETTSNSPRRIVKNFLNSNPKKSQIYHQIEIPEDEEDIDDREYDEPDWYRDERDEWERSQNEQLGVGYVMKTKPSDPLDR